MLVAAALFNLECDGISKHNPTMRALEVDSAQTDRGGDGNHCRASNLIKKAFISDGERSPLPYAEYQYRAFVMNASDCSGLRASSAAHPVAEEE